MTIRAIDHINIATTKLKETRDFYVDVLGLTEGDRPPFDFPGHWLYADGFPIVHMQLSAKEVTSSALSGLNHAAFQVADLDAVIARLEAAGVRHTTLLVPGTTIRQAFFQDPNGVRLELNEARAVRGV
ncbi:VOC family protein [Phenylobacterium sp.]|uniref:VOC family protein n=1 Tax=Phenylobacterium sp. TaxID=1871053 RepID=UPI0025DBFC79|nr:VOC family protein [Phenylobacterium sp.]